MPQKAHNSLNEFREVTTGLHEPCHVVEVEPHAEQCRESLVEKHKYRETIEGVTEISQQRPEP